MIFAICIMAVAIAGCGSSNSRDMDRMPDIAFAYFNHDVTNENWDDIWMFTKGGEVYQTHNQAYKSCYYILEIGDGIKEDDTCMFIRNIDPQTLKENHDVLLEVVDGGKEELIDKNGGSEFVTNEYKGQYDWIGFALDKKGEPAIITLSREGDYDCYNKDTRAGELAAWMKEIVFQSP